MTGIMANHRWAAVSLAIALGAGAAPRAGRAAASAPAPQRTSRFELAVVPLNGFGLAPYQWRTAWPRLRAARPLLTVKGSEVVAYDWQRQTLTLDAAVTRRLAAALPTMSDRSERVR